MQPSAVDPSTQRSAPPVAKRPFLAHAHGAQPAAVKQKSIWPYTALSTQPKAQVQPKSIRSRARSLIGWRNLWIAVGGIVGLLLCFQSLSLGEAAIGLYAIAALTLRFSSRATFVAALLGLGGILLFLALQGEDTLSENFAVYTFLLLAVGTVSLGLETHRACD